jgi:hypothetical protein
MILANKNEVQRIDSLNLTVNGIEVLSSWVYLKGFDIIDQFLDDNHNIYNNVLQDLTKGT